ncbi:PHP domain-containing protein [Longispora sp. K20-0274]|uniref:PHP domain-containing protein n=1 Tax=Longispora sp. K20-0274 TaxID=3088255 RepID=UPI00399BCD10
MRTIAFALERAGEGSYRVQAFRQAADAVAGLGATAVAAHLAAGTLTHVPGIGAVTAACVAESVAGQEPSYLRKISAPEPTALRAELRGDCHSHTNWSDGSHSVEEMALAAMELGHDYLAVTDHSPRLTIARGLSAERLAEQLAVVAAVNRVLGRRLRVLSGIEVDILADGTLDQADDLLDQLDVVVASVHSGLREAGPRMTRRMLRAVTDPRVNILGHCTGRLRSERRTRPESAFDAAAVFAACAEHQVAVEINSRPERLDPPTRLLRLAVDAGCLFSIDSDAHAPGQLDWLDNGCARAERVGVPTERIVNTWPVDRLLAWSRRLR